MDPRYNDMATEQELAEVLSHYDSNLVYDVVREHINYVRSTANVISMPPNVVAAWEQNFQYIKSTYQSEEAVENVRQETYREIIDIICGSYGLNFTIDEVDLYTAACALYNFFVCEFASNVTTFFANYIYNERAAIYDSMGLSELKKNKDSSTIYGKRMYKDIKIAVVTANIVKVIHNICNGMEFDYPTFISIAARDNKQAAEYLLQITADGGNFFSNIVVPCVAANLADYVTNIRFKIQESAVLHDQVIYNPTNTIEGE
jgi:hypothetical protein